MPEVYKQLRDVAAKLEHHYKDMQDIEFTVEDGRLYMLQTRNGKRTAAAALRIAVELAEEGLIDRKTAVGRIDPSSLDQLLHPTLDPKAAKSILTRGLPASPGAASGIVTFSADEAERARFAALIADAEAVRAEANSGQGPVSQQPERCSSEMMQRALRAPWVLLARDSATYEDWQRDVSALRERLAIVERIQTDYLEGRSPDSRYAPDADTWNVTSFAAERMASTDARLQELYARAIRDQVPRIVAFGDAAAPFQAGLSDTAREHWAFLVPLAPIDCSNTAWLRAQVETHGWFNISQYGERADEAAWLIVQHADRTPAFQGEMLALLQERAEAGETQPRRVAYLSDRVAVKEGRPQRYGTQMHCVNGEAQPMAG